MPERPLGDRAAAIPLAERLGAALLVDDGAARIVARERGLHVVGTLGVLLLAKQRGTCSASRRSSGG
jgi:predicted nucleic acid-binding protein